MHRHRWHAVVVCLAQESEWEYAPLFRYRPRTVSGDTFACVSAGPVSFRGRGAKTPRTRLSSSPPPVDIPRGAHEGPGGVHGTRVSAGCYRCTPWLGVADFLALLSGYAILSILIVPIIPVVTAESSKCSRNPVCDSIPFDDVLISTCGRLRCPLCVAHLWPSLAEVAVPPRVGRVHLAVLVYHRRAPGRWPDRRRRALRVEGVVESEGEHALGALHDLRVVDSNACPLD